MITVRLFASLREALGSDTVQVEASEPVSVPQLIDLLATRFGAPWRETLSQENVLVAVNQEMADASVRITDSDEVAFFPPVTGG